MYPITKTLIIPFILFLAYTFSPELPSHSPTVPLADTLRLKQAMDAFRIEEGLKIELIAAEPLVSDPVALAFDENKRMYVIEDHGYPDPAEGGTPTTLGKIALLEDRDGDGQYDHRSEFASGLTYPNGLLPWRGGIFVTCAPDIYYLKDSDGDGIADIKKVVLTGFSNNRTAQIRVSHPTLGLDGLVYVTSGLNSGKVTSPLFPDRSPVSFSASDGRFDPETFVFETTGGRSQFGLSFDAYGRRFGCSNRHPVQQIVLEPWHLRRNSHLSFAETTENVSKVEAEAIVFPISGAITSADFIPKLMGLSHTGTFTSASGVFIFNGTGLTPAHQGNAFICESAQNLIQRQVMVPQGVSFKSELPYRDREFLSSTDEWFRPVFLQHGPEGALYLADMHRKVIDHPSYVPEEARAGLDFESGKTDGRIYRIVREDFPQTPPTSVRFDSGSDRIQALQSTEEWTRQTAHRLLLESPDQATVPMLKKMVTTSNIPESRVRALWLLYSYQALDQHTLISSLSDEEAGIREQAVTLCGKLATKHPELIDHIAHTSSDKALRVRFMGALALGPLKGPKVLDALVQVAAQDGDDKWVRTAVLSGIGNRLPQFFKLFRNQTSFKPEAFTAVMQDLGKLFGNGATISDCRLLLTDVLASTQDEPWRVSTVLGLAEAISKRPELNIGSEGVLFALLGSEITEKERMALLKFVDIVSSKAANTTLPSTLKVPAVALLGYTDYDRSGKVLQGLMDARNTPEIQLQAVSSLAQLADVRGGSFLTQQKVWSNYTPTVKSAVVATLVSKPAFIEVLFNAIQTQVIGPAEISSMDRQRLMKHKDADISSRANTLFEELEGGGRMKVYQEYRSILNTTANPKAGKQVFERACSACHTYAGVGGKVGPDLTGVRNQPADALLLHILVPNYEVLPAYQAISVETKDGRALSGWLMAETDNSLSLKTAFGTQESILRKNIKVLTNSGLSLMPDGLEQTMTKPELAELIAFLKDNH